MSRTILAVLTIVAVGCNSSPLAPSPPPPRAVASFSTMNDLDFPDWPCRETGLCSYTFTARNDGPDCATNVSGTITIKRGGGVVASDMWMLDASRVVRPQEQVKVKDSGLDYYQLVGEGLTFTVEYRFTAVSCP